jgi:hypothetical protein
MGTIISSAPLTKVTPVFVVTGFTAVTGVTTNQQTGSVLIPANTVDGNIATGNAIDIVARAVKTGTAGTLQIRIYANTTDSLSGATLIGTSPIATAVSLYVQISRTAFIGKPPINTKLMQVGGNAYDDITNFTGAETSVAIDWAANQYIILAVQNGSTADSTIGSGIIFKIYK